MGWQTAEPVATAFSFFCHPRYFWLKKYINKKKKELNNRYFSVWYKLKKDTLGLVWSKDEAKNPYLYMQLNFVCFGTKQRIKKIFLLCCKTQFKAHSQHFHGMEKLITLQHPIKHATLSAKVNIFTWGHRTIIASTVLQLFVTITPTACFVQSETNLPSNSFQGIEQKFCTKFYPFNQ